MLGSMFLPSRRAAPPLRDRTVVVTGASAGVGRAVALELARRGARVGLVAREHQALLALQAEIEAGGGKALSLPADVSDDAAVFAAAEQCERELGPIEVWINNAMATVVGRVTETTPAEIRRVTEVTYLGYVNGTLAALRHMSARDRGVVVQVGSALAYRGIPLQAAYCAAKHAIRGFTDSLRCELLHDGSRIQLTAVHLPAINTPQFDWSRTHRRQAPRPVAPVYSPQAAARAVIEAALHPQREIWLGTNTPLMILADMLAPSLIDRILARKAFSGQDADHAVSPGRSDNLFTPVPGKHRTSGSFGDEARGSALGYPSGASRVVALAIACGLSAAAAAAATAAASRRRDRDLSP